ncbi:MAG: LPS O-antigen length regulator [unclassified Hahellaceae]|nr:LPS O-antigen length regulator [Hahellaceae bacterium]|tara:strand:+ start:6376 stop:7341 length:966 start_codon:yes stop_codon:yes gene_type:complete
MTKYEPYTYEPTKEAANYPDDEIDLRELFLMLWRGKWIILVTTILFSATGVFYAFSQPNIYQASVLLAPTQNEGGVNGIGGQLGGLASLAGINLGGGGANKTVMANEVLRSRAFLTEFIHRHDLVIPLMATKAWNMRESQWVIDRELYNPTTQQWLTNAEGKTLQPTDWDMVNKFRSSHLSVSENKENGMVTLSVKSQSPTVAKAWADMLVNDINEHMRQQDVKESEARIAYLEEKLSETNIAGMQQVFYQLIESETRTVMLANARDEYIFKTVDPAVVPQEKSGPKRALTAIVATMLGGMLGIFLVFVIAFIRNSKKPAI